MKNGMIVDEYGTKKWYLNGKYHRVDGPAIVWADGSKWWCLNGELLTKEEWLAATTQKLLDMI